MVLCWWRNITYTQRASNTEPYFSYELSAEPTSLFKDKYMRKTDKSQLAKAICNGVETLSIPRQSKPVIDGGYLLRVVTWSGGACYADVTQQYVQ